MSGKVGSQFTNSGVIGSPVLGEPASGVMTNLTGTLTSPTFVTPALGTPASGVASNLTALDTTELSAGVLPTDITGGAGLTLLGTVTAGNVSHASIVYPDEVVFFGEHNTVYTSTDAVMVWNVALYDPESGHSSGVYTIPKAGDYLIVATAKGDGGNITGSATGVKIFKGSSEQDASAAVGYQNGTNTRFQVTSNIILSCAASNTITIKTYLEGPGNSNNVHGGLLTIARMGV
jgi:hypothetical protein